MDQQTNKTPAESEFSFTAAQPFLNETYNTPSFVDFASYDEIDREANLFTQMQVHDSYREGTIDAKIDDSKNNMEKIRREPYDL